MSTLIKILVVIVIFAGIYYLAIYRPPEKYTDTVLPGKQLHELDNKNISNMPIQTNIVESIDESDSALDEMTSNELAPDQNKESSYANGKRDALSNDFVKAFDESNNLMNNSGDGDYKPNEAMKFQSYVSDGNNGTDITDIFSPKNVLPAVETKDMKTLLIKNTSLLNPTMRVGIDTIATSHKNSSWDIRPTPINPKTEVSPWMNSTIGPDDNIVNGPLCI